MNIKELLSEVLLGFDYMGETVEKIYKTEYSESAASVVFWYGKKEDDIGTINIYELAHKCKEWAYTQQYRLISFCEPDMPYGDCLVESIFGDDDWSIRFFNNTEPEAIFKACQWILDNKETK